MKIRYLLPAMLAAVVVTGPVYAEPPDLAAKGEAIGQYVDDAAITTQVKAALAKDKQVSAMAVTVTTEQGVVILSGEVSSEAARKLAEQHAAAVKGVKKVVNELTVKPAA